MASGTPRSFLHLVDAVGYWIAFTSVPLARMCSTHCSSQADLYLSSAVWLYSCSYPDAASPRQANGQRSARRERRVRNGESACLHLHLSCREGRGLEGREG